MINNKFAIVQKWPKIDVILFPSNFTQTQANTKAKRNLENDEPGVILNLN